MTRLIDADAYEHAVQGNPYVSDSVKTYVRCSIQSQPTIDAIPISFIEKKIETIRDYLREHEGEAFNEGLISRAVAYRKLIEDWMSERV